MKTSILINILFVGILFVFSMSYLFLPINKDSELENRKLAQFPQVKEGISVFSGEWMNEIDTYLSDQVLGRAYLVRFANLIRSKFMIGNKVGKYYIAENNQMIAPFCGSSALSVKYIDSLFSSLKIPVNIILVPSKSEVYYEYLPAYHGLKITDKYTQIGNEINRVKSYNVVFLNLYETEWNNPNERLYYETDHHWTQLGSYNAYRLLMKTIGYSPLPKKTFELDLIEDCFLGSRARQTVNVDVCSEYYGIVNGENFPIRNNYGGTWKDGLRRSKETFGMWGNYYRFLGHERHFAEAVKYGTWKYINDKPVVNEKILILGNSMAIGILPWLAVTFKEVHRWDLRDDIGNNSITLYVEKEGIDRIMFFGYEGNLTNNSEFFYKP